MIRTFYCTHAWVPFDTYLCKPFVTEVCAADIASYGRDGWIIEGDSLNLGTFTIDPNSKIEIACDFLGPQPLHLIVTNVQPTKAADAVKITGYERICGPNGKYLDGETCSKYPLAVTLKTPTKTVTAGWPSKNGNNGGHNQAVYYVWQV